MKKYLILVAVVALMTACNEKPAKNDSQDAKAPATEQVDTALKASAQPKVKVEKAAPTEDGKDHVAAEFADANYQVRLENLADGTYRLSLWKAGQDKAGKPEQVIETKQCVMDKDNFLLKGNDGKNYVIRAAAGKESLVIMDNKGVIYPKK